MWFRALGKSEAENGADQCLKLLQELRQISWPTVDIVRLDIDSALQQYVLHYVADSRRLAFHSCFGSSVQHNGLRMIKNWGQNR